MAHTVAIANQKGGVGKTTTAISVSSSVAVAEKKALVVDMDPQANLTSGLGMEPAASRPTVYRGLIQGTPAQEIIRDTQLETLKLMPSERNLTGAELELVDQPRREYRLRELLAPVAPAFDYVFIDCPPSLGLLTLNALVAADSVLIPLQCEFFALAGVTELLSTVERVRSAFNPDLRIEGIVFTMVDERTNLTNQVMEDVRDNFPGVVFTTVIPRNIRLAEAPSFGKPILLYDIRSKGAEAYLSLTREILSHEAQSVG
ncbi:MAG TPA: ParA family protein [Vicinamibacteria bacterium]|nr:ParA family protein [Vicinamibacteria bacterium]